MSLNINAFSPSNTSRATPKIFPDFKPSTRSGVFTISPRDVLTYINPNVTIKKLYVSNSESFRLYLILVTYNNDILWHLVNSLLVDHMMSLWQEWNMNWENVWPFEQFFKRNIFRIWNGGNPIFSWESIIAKYFWYQST